MLQHPLPIAHGHECPCYDMSLAKASSKGSPLYDFITPRERIMARFLQPGVEVSNAAILIADDNPSPRSAYFNEVPR